ncbi:hypothetical protein RintRC_6477 [Richelia intracellularis]|nr:hypothetical protein RintRC_6477 [Richelia intracellularis]
MVSWLSKSFTYVNLRGTNFLALLNQGIISLNFQRFFNGFKR